MAEITPLRYHIEPGPENLQPNLEKSTAGLSAKRVFLDMSELGTGASPCELKFRKHFQMLSAHRNDWELGT